MQFPFDILHLRLLLERTREAAYVLLERTLVAQELHVRTIDLETTLLAFGDVFLATERSEAPVLGHDDLLPAGELVLRAAESLDGGGAVSIPGADREDDLANVDTGNSAVRLAKGTTHSSLQPIGTGARQHLVDTDDVVWVSADAEMETFLAGNLDEVLVRADAGGFESLGAQLFVLIGDEVDAAGELVDVGALAAQVEDADLGIGHTTVEARLRVWLVLAVAVAPRWTACHFESACGCCLGL